MEKEKKALLSRYKGRVLACAVGGLLIVFLLFFWRNRAEEQVVLNKTAAGTKATVVLDPGHGGFDPGKVGTAGAMEKDINLAIAKKAQKILEDSGYTVIMTREEDVALCTGTEKSKKMTDLRNRVEIIEKAGPALAVSIHQNSYSAGTKGTQVFYYSASGNEETEGKKLAGILQNTIRDVVGDDNKRVEKGNSSYYMLKNVTCPFAIVECGFLSNPTEEAMLCDENYQQKMAEGICEGIENFLYK